MANVISVKDFVQETIMQICDAVRECQRHPRTDGIVVGPVINTIDESKDENGMFTQSTHQAPSILSVEFDLSVAAEESEASGDHAKLGFGLNISVVKAEGGIGGKSSRESSNSSVQKLKFAIPVAINNGKNVNVLKKFVRMPDAAHPGNNRASI